MGRLLSLPQALRVRKRLGRRGKKVVFTNGVFDILHVGHTRYLQQARELGDVLFVGLNSDTSATMLKGQARPWVPGTERAELLCALSCVDYVVVFNENTAVDLVAALQPDVYVKGGDYSPAASPGSDSPASGSAVPGDVKPLPEAAAVEKCGGKIVILPYTPGHSTSILAARIQQGLNRAGAQ
jgi:rfaE bifunctional protein nucleotidyltransferase chain/domain